MFCPNCGASVTEGRKFCGKCGAALNSRTVEKKAAAPSVPYVPVETVAPPSAQPTSPQRKAAYALVALLVILGGVGWWLLHGPPSANALVGTWQYGSEKGIDSSGKYDPVGYLRIVKSDSGQFQFFEGFPCAEVGGAICWHPDDGYFLNYTNGKLETTIQSYNFRATHAVVFDYHLAVERVDENDVLYTMKSDGLALQEVHKAHRMELAAQSATPSNIVPNTDNSIESTRSVTANPQQSKRLNVEGIRIMSMAHPDFNDAKRVFEQATKLNQNNIEALNNLGYVYSRLGDYRFAEPILIRVIELAPTRKVAQGNLGEVQAKLGKTQDAANHFCQYVRLFDSLEHGKSILARTFNDPDPNVQAAVSFTLANCN